MFLRLLNVEDVGQSYQLVTGTVLFAMLHYCFWNDITQGSVDNLTFSSSHPLLFCKILHKLPSLASPQNPLPGSLFSSRPPSGYGDHLLPCYFLRRLLPVSQSWVETGLGVQGPHHSHTRLRHRCAFSEVQECFGNRAPLLTEVGQLLALQTGSFAYLIFFPGRWRGWLE